MNFWISLLVVLAVLVYYYSRLSFERLEVFKMLLTSFVPLAILILAANISRFRGRIQKIGSQRVKLITDPAQPEQKIDLASR